MKNRQLGEVQLKIMQVLWEKGRANAQEITSIVNQDQQIVHSTVQVLLLLLIMQLLPGALLANSKIDFWKQNNNRPDLRLWQDKSYWRRAAEFWRELATSLKDHLTVVAYNIINEPTPEKGTGLSEDGPAERYLRWYREYQGTSNDLPAFYETVIEAIRERDTDHVGCRLVRPATCLCTLTSDLCVPQ